MLIKGLRSILVVEDESIVALDLSHTLQRLGYEVCAICHNLKTAFEKAVESAPDLALVDISLNEPEDGIELSERLHRELDIPVVFLTANVDALVIQRALASDAYGYLVKPYNEHMLHAAIQMALRRYDAVKQLKNSEERYRTLFESMSQGVTIRNRESRILIANPAAQRIYDQGLQDLIGTFPTDYYDIFDPSGNLLPEEKHPSKIVFRTGKPVEEQILQVRHRQTGRVRWHKVTAIPQFEPNQTEPARVISIFEDITEKHLTEQALRESEKNYRLLAENAIDVIWQLDLQTMSFTYISPSIYRLRGLTVEEALNEPVAHALDDEGRALVQNDLPLRIRRYDPNNPSSSGQVNLLRQPHKDGRWIWVEIVTSLVPDHTGAPRYLLGVSRSADERVRAQQEVLASQKRYQILFEQVVDAVIVNEIGPNGEPGAILEANTAACSMYGWPREEFIGQNIAVISPVLPSPIVSTSQDPIAQKLFIGEDVAFEKEMVTRDGRLFPAEIFGRLLDYNGKRAVLAVSRDISARKQAEAEIQKLNIDLEHRVFERTAELENALKELETFAYSVSHDLKTPLRAIDGFSQILLEDYGSILDQTGQDHLNRVRRATERMGQLIDDLLAYSRLERRDLVIGPVQIRRVVDQLIVETNEEITRRGVEVEINLLCPEVIAETQGVTQSLRNLLENALKFSAAQENPRIEIGSRKIEDRVRIWVKDNGIGFDMRYHDQIYDIFKRLHRGDEYPGTGVGLAIARKAMQRVGGNIWAESSPGLGATFFLEFPD